MNKRRSLQRRSVGVSVSVRWNNYRTSRRKKRRSRRRNRKWRNRRRSCRRRLWDYLSYQNSYLRKWKSGGCWHNWQRKNRSKLNSWKGGWLGWLLGRGCELRKKRLYLRRNLKIRNYRIAFKMESKLDFGNDTKLIWE